MFIVALVPLLLLLLLLLLATSITIVPLWVALAAFAAGVHTQQMHSRQCTGMAVWRFSRNGCGQTSLSAMVNGKSIHELQ